MIQDKKKIGELRICVNLRKMNDACLHDPFPIPFIDEVLEIVRGKEMIHLLMDFWAIIKCELRRRIATKKPSSPDGDATRIG